MRHRLEREETVEGGAKRILGRELDDALGSARDRRLGVDERVHEVRLALKRARAVLALVTPEVGAAASRDDRALRKVGRALAAARDGAVAREALGALSRRAEGSAAAARRSKLGARLRAALSTEDAEGRLRDAERALARVRSKVGRWKVSHGRRAIVTGVESVYRRARRACRDVATDDDAARFHAWRKAVKRLGIQVALLGDGAPSSFAAREPLLDRLGKLLGELHDLSFLAAAVAAAGRSHDLSAERDRWLAVLDARAGELRPEARALGAALFSEKPSRFGRRIGASWTRWRR